MPRPTRITSFAFALVLGAGLATALTAQDNDPDPEDLEQAIDEEAPVVAFADPGRFVAQDGEALYRSICQACHMPDGQGAVGAGAYPALAGNPMIEFPEYPVQVVIHGQNAMPAFGAYLDDAQVAAVVNYIRTNLGNTFTEDPATPEMASETR
jgi:mono/diheme cytochrome c family protein